MLFNSIEFLFIFLPIVFFVYFLLNKYKLFQIGNFWLAISSLFFYAYYKIEYLPIIITSILFNYTIGYFLQKPTSKIPPKIILIFGLVGNLLLLCYYKYWDFLIESFNKFANQNFDTMHLLLPLGISFFTFQQISYLVDCYKKEAKPSNIIDYSLFVTFFPQLIAGPIVHHKEIIPQIQDKTQKRINPTNVSLGFFLITIGLVKKVLIGDNFIPFFNDTLAGIDNLSMINTWLFALVTAMWGYFDFSGYCDMALGIANLFNIKLPINFNSPYKSLDISDYWRRWHITLGRFFKNYVYIPLGGSRAGTLKTYRNLFIVFFLTGVWHGANWPCLLYGIINGLLVSLNKYWKTFKIEMNHFLATFITFLTMVFIVPLVMIKTLAHCLKIWTSMLGFNTFYTLPKIENSNFIFDNNAKINIYLVAIALIIIFCFKNSNELSEKYLKTDKPIFAAILAVLFIIASLSITKASEFIYFQF